MSNKREYHIIIGSIAFFDKKAKDWFKNEEVGDFLNLVKLSDDAKRSGGAKPSVVDRMIVKNHHYHGIVDTAHDRLGPLIEDLTEEGAEICVHNPPRVLAEYLNDQKNRGIIELDAVQEKYIMERNPNLFSDNIRDIANHIIGQQEAIQEIGKSLWYLSKVEREKPYVIMLYGDSSLGKTELAREIAEKFFDGKYLEKHLSMFKNNNYSDYFFGDAPNRRSLGFELLERESNLVFLDELDKCPDYFYSAFYTLFDNAQFKDATYDVDMSGAIIFLTSNYRNEDEMKKFLGLPIFYRIDKFIQFNDFNTDVIVALTKKAIKEREAEYKEYLSFDDIYAAASRRILGSNENARTIQYKVQQVIEELLFQEIQDKLLD